MTAQDLFDRYPKEVQNEAMKLAELTNQRYWRYILGQCRRLIEQRLEKPPETFSHWRFVYRWRGVAYIEVVKGRNINDVKNEYAGRRLNVEVLHEFEGAMP